MSTRVKLVALLAIPVIALVVVAFAFGFGHSTSEPTEATGAAAGGMSLSVKTGSEACASGDPADVCAPVGGALVISVSVDTLPKTDGFLTVQSFVSHGALTYKGGLPANDIDDVLFDCGGLKLGNVGAGNVSTSCTGGSIIAPVPQTTTGQYVDHEFTCTAADSTVNVTLEALGSPVAGGSGAGFVHSNGVTQTAAKDSLTIHCQGGATVTPTPTPSEASTATPTITPTFTITPTPIVTATPTMTPTASNTPMITPTPTITLTPTVTPTATSTATPTNTPVPPTATNTPVPPTATNTPTVPPTPGGSINGTVTDEGTGDPLESICVTIYDSSFFFVGSGFTDASGAYTVSGLPNGDFKVEFRDCGFPATYVTEWYDDQPDFASATPVAVTKGSKTSIDAELAVGASINGTVTEEGTGMPLQDICVGVTDTSGNLVAFSFTDSAGAYSMSGLASGEYKVTFVDCFSFPAGYITEWYNDKPDVGSADVVELTKGSKTDNIDAALARFGSITICKATNPETTGVSFDFSGDLGDFALEDDRCENFADLELGQYSVTENEPSGWTLTDIECVGTPSENVAIDLGNETVTIDLKSDQDVVCSFINEPPITSTPTPTVTDPPTNTPTATATPTVTNTPTVTPTPVTSVSVSPLSRTVSTATASVDIAVADVIDLGSYEFTLTWDSAVLSFTNVSNGTLLGSTGRTVNCLAPPTTTATSVTFNCSTTGASPGPDGTGILATVEFATVADGTSPLVLSSVALTDTSAESIALTTTNDSLTFVSPTATPTPTATPFRPDLTVTKSDSPDPVPSGGTLTYTIEVSNIGLVGVDFVRMVDTPPATFTISGFSTDRGACGLDGATPGGTLDCDLGSFGTGPGAVATITITGFLTAAADAVVVNTATVDPADIIAESTETNNSVTISTTVLATTATPTATPTNTPTATATSSPTPTNTPTSTATNTPTNTPTATPTFFSEASPTVVTPCVLLGDVNGDGIVNATDAALTLQLLAGLIGSLPCQQNGDVDGSGIVDVIDAALILQLSAGFIDSFSVTPVSLARYRGFGW